MSLRLTIGRQSIVLSFMIFASYSRLLVTMNPKTSARKCVIVIMSVLCQTTTYINGDTTDESGSHTPEDETLLMQTVRLHEFIQSRPNVKTKVAPVVALDDKETAVDVCADSVVNVLRVDDVQQTMTTFVSCTISWQDSSLQWNSSHYGGVGMIELDWHSVWTPLIRIINGVDTDTNVLRPDFVNVYSNGLVTGDALLIPETTCNMNHDMFPYDTQRCPLAIAPMSSYVRLEITFQTLSNDLSSSLQQPDWKLVKLTNGSLTLNPNKGPCPTVQVELRRLTTFYTVCLVIPMVLTSYMNTMVFLVPLQSGEKVSFIVSIFVSTSVFANFFSTIMPRGLDSVPATMKLFVGVVMESLVTLVATLFVMWQFHSQTDTSITVSPPSESDSKEPKEEASEDIKKPPQPNAQPVCIDLRANSCARQVQVAPLTTSYCGQGLKSSGATFDGVLKRVFSMPAERVDRIFFALFFMAKTIFISFLYM